MGECLCAVSIDYDEDGTVKSAKILRCPRHDAADEMLKAIVYTLGAEGKKEKVALGMLLNAKALADGDKDVGDNGNVPTL